MASTEYIFCKWKSRFWPAKILLENKHLPKNSQLMVEIFAVNKQITVKFKDTKPFLKVELDNIADQLDMSENYTVTREELTYRKALRGAIDIITQLSTKATEGIEVAKDCRSGACSRVRTKTEPTSGGQESPRTTIKRNKTQERSMVKGDIKPVKRRKDSSAATTDELSKYPKRSGIKTLSPTKRKIVHIQLKPIGHRQLSKKRSQDANTEQDELFCGKETAHNVSHSDIPAAEQSCGENEISRGKLKGSLCSAKEMEYFMTPDDNGSEKIKPRPVQRRPRLLKKLGVQEAITKSQAETSDTKISVIHTECKRMEDMPDFEEERGLSSSELSMEISSPEYNCLCAVSPQDDTEEDIPLPVISLQKGPVSFTPGAFVWCKFQRFPYWPSVVKAVQRKHKKASIIFLEESFSDPKEKTISFTVAFRSLKHYDCSEKQELLEIARKDYGRSIDWCESLISDYRIRLGCGSFSGSFIDYCSADISLPVRREFKDGKLQVHFPSIVPEVRKERAGSKSHMNSKVLPDRERAARDRANEKLVEFIVKTKQAENHLIDILKGKKMSHWLKKFQSSKQRVNCLETYIEDEEQMEHVVGYLQTLCENMNSAEKKLMNGDQTKFILEVLFPEAVISAISATDQINYEKAEKKYLKGPSVSKRERKLFDEQILEKKRCTVLESKTESNE